MSARFSIILLVCIVCVLFSCHKDKSSIPQTVKPVDVDTTKPPVTPPIVPPVIVPAGSLFSDSILYVNNLDDYSVLPINTKAGTYSCAPDGLKIEETTGAINVNKSETGLKYLVTFTPADGSQPQSTYLIISGINYQDKVYNLSAGDSIAAPIYNADSHLSLPGAGQNDVFDEGGGCGKAGIIVDGKNARINLAETVRKQLIDTGSTEEVKLAYRINDNSALAPNGLDVKIYFYRTASEIPQYLLDLINERKTTILASGNRAHNLALNHIGLRTLQAAQKKPSRPRPPCIVVVGR